MTGAIAVMAHAGAKPTIDAFLPQWKKLGPPIFAFLPSGDKWPSAPINGVVVGGESARTGNPVFLRFLDMCKRLLTAHFDAYFIMEYDTVNLTNKLPRFNPSVVNSGLVALVGMEGHSQPKCSMSPWVLTRAMLAALVEAMQMELRDPCNADLEQFHMGLLDRWIGVACMRAHLPQGHLPDVLPYPWDTKEDVHKRIADDGISWVHGWKTKENFRHLWPNP